MKTTHQPLNVLVACEFTGTVRDAFLAAGHNTFSVDLLPSESCPERHVRARFHTDEGDGDVGKDPSFARLPVMRFNPRDARLFSTRNSLHTADWETACEEGWDIMVAHPPCTHLAVSGSGSFAEKVVDGRQDAGAAFFMYFTGLPSSYVRSYCIENPVGVMSTRWRKPDQTIQPWQFGVKECKGVCLWMKGLAPLTPTEVVGPPPCSYAAMTVAQRREWYPKVMLPPSPDRGLLRSRFFPEIAAAMADQLPASSRIFH